MLETQGRRRLPWTAVTHRPTRPATGTGTRSERVSPAVTALTIALQVLLVGTSLLLVPLVLLHKGKGGGLSDMFGGGITSSAGSSGVAERNLNRITVGVALVWAVVIILLGLVERVS